MKAKLGLAWALVLVLNALARAQTNFPGGGNYPPFNPPVNYGPAASFYYGSSTVGEGWARGIGEVIRAQGEYNLATSAAAVNFSEARRHEIENNKLWVQTYFEIREIHRQAREAEENRRRWTPEDWVRYAQAGKPRPLKNSELDAVTGKITWPILLRGDALSGLRSQLQQAFLDRTYHGVIGPETLTKVTQATDDMLAALRLQIRDVPPPQYIEARRFLQSLAYEASQPAG
jgi:hypothetical protein